MKKIFLVIVVSFCGMLNIQAQTKTSSKDSSISVLEDRNQNLITDSTEKNKIKRSYGKAIVQYIVSKKRDTSFVKIEVECTLPDEAERLKQYLLKNLDANTPKKNKAKPGTYEVIVQFIVSKDGTTSDVTPLTSMGYGMEADVVLVVKKGPRWLPARQNSNIVKPYRTSAVK